MRKLKVWIIVGILGIGLIGCKNDSMDNDIESEKTVNTSSIEENYNEEQVTKDETVETQSNKEKNIMTDLSNRKSNEITANEMLKIVDYYNELYSNFDRAYNTSKINQIYLGDTNELLGFKNREELSVRVVSKKNESNKEVAYVYREIHANLDAKGNLIETDMLKLFLQDLKDCYIVTNDEFLNSEISRLYNLQNSEIVRAKGDTYSENTGISISVDGTVAQLKCVNIYNLIGDIYTPKYSYDEIIKINQLYIDDIALKIKNILNSNNINYTEQDSNDKQKKFLSLDDGEIICIEGLFNDGKKFTIEYEDKIIFDYIDNKLNEIYYEIEKTCYNTSIESYKLDLPKYEELYDYVALNKVGEESKRFISYIHDENSINFSPYSNVRITGYHNDLQFLLPCNVDGLDGNPNK